MSYTSRAYERNWNYEATDDTFDARVGKILAGGLDLKASLREKALGELEATLELGAANERREAAAANVNLNAPVGGGFGGPGGGTGSSSSRRVDTRGYVWVDPQGRTMGPVGSGELGGSGEVPPGPQTLTSRRLQVTERQAAVMAMNTTERSMNLWKKLNPGCVEETNRTPRSTFKDHFGPKADQPDADKVDKTYHYQKTDFSEYTEVKLRLMNHLK